MNSFRWKINVIDEKSVSSINIIDFKERERVLGKKYQPSVNCQRVKVLTYMSKLWNVDKQKKISWFAYKVLLSTIFDADQQVDNNTAYVTQIHYLID